MGNRLSWVAAKGLDKAAMLETFGFVETGEIEDDSVGRMSVAEFPGWTVLRSDDFSFFEPPTLAARFPEGEVVGGQCYDSVMYSGAYGFEGGRQIWSVVNDPDEDPFALATTGRPPKELDVIRRRLDDQQAAETDDEVNYVYEGPMLLTAALTGFHPGEWRPRSGVVFHAVEGRLSGAAGERQAAARALRERLKEAVLTQLVPAAEALGFEPVARRPDFLKFHGPNPAVLVRLRGEWSDTLEFRWAADRDGPRVEMVFFVRRGAESRYGEVGLAWEPPPRRSILDRLTGKNKEHPEAAFERAVGGTRALIDAVDRYLKDGTPHPRIRPPRYFDDEPAD